MTRNFTLPALLLAGSIFAFGQPIDPATLHIGTGVGTACVQGCPNIVGGNEVTATGTTFDIFQQSASSKLLASEMLLVVAVPNTATGAVTAGSVLTATEFDPYNVGGSGTAETIAAGQTPFAYGNVNTTLLNEATLTSGQDVFTVLGPNISAADNSESFGNFNSAYAAEVAAGTAGFSGVPSSYTLYVWSISTTNFNGNSATNITSTLPVGSFLAAFGEEASCAPLNCNNGGEVFSTQFTNTGLVTASATTTTSSSGPGGGPASGPQVPEPSGIVLLGTALLAVTAGLRKKFIHS